MNFVIVCSRLSCYILSRHIKDHAVSKCLVHRNLIYFLSWCVALHTYMRFVAVQVMLYKEAVLWLRMCVSKHLQVLT
jgi:hypothetical protein